MNVYEVAGLIFAFGAAGGIVNCLVTGARKFLPGYDEHNIWQPGWAGSLVLGGMAAAVIWGTYGASASFDLLGTQPYEGHLALTQLFTSVLIGMGGNRILTAEAQKWILRSQRDAEETAKENVIKVNKVTLDALAKAVHDQPKDN